MFLLTTRPGAFIWRAVLHPLPHHYCMANRQLHSLYESKNFLIHGCPESNKYLPRLKANTVTAFCSFWPTRVMRKDTRQLQLFSQWCHPTGNVSLRSLHRNSRQSADSVLHKSLAQVRGLHRCKTFQTTTYQLLPQTTREYGGQQCFLRQLSTFPLPSTKASLPLLFPS